MANTSRILIFFLVSFFLSALFVWHSNQRFNAEYAWIENKMSQDRYADALLWGCYEVAGADPLFPTEQQKQNILSCLRWELSAMARTEGVELSEKVLDAKLKSVSNKIRAF